VFFTSRIASAGELNALVMELRAVASPVLKIAGSHLQIRKVQFLQILYVAQCQP